MIVMEKKKKYTHTHRLGSLYFSSSQFFEVPYNFSN